MKRSVKWIAFAVAFVVVFALHVKVTPLTERAIIVALGIDKTEDGLLVSAEILRPSQDQSKSAGYILAYANARTVSEGLDKITNETTGIGTLSHCDLVVLGEGIAESDAYSAIDYVYRNAYLSENAVLITAKGTAKELLDAKTPYADTGAFYIEQASDTVGRSLSFVRKNVKDFIASYYTQNGANWLSEVVKTEVEKPKTSDGASGGEDGEESKEYAFSYETASVFIKNEKVLSLDKTATRGINICSEDLDRGAVNVTASDGTEYGFYVATSKCKKKYDAGSLTATFTIDVTFVLKEVFSKEGVSPYTPDVEPPEEVTELTKGELRECVLSAFNECRNVGADIFDLYGGFYGASADRKKIPDDYLSRATLNVIVNVKYV